MKDNEILEKEENEEKTETTETETLTLPNGEKEITTKDEKKEIINKWLSIFAV